MLEDELAGARRVGEDDALADPRRERRRIMFGEAMRGLAGDDRARGTAIEDEAGYERGAKDARLGDQREHLGRCPAVEGRRLSRDQREVSGEQR